MSGEMYKQRKKGEVEFVKQSDEDVKEVLREGWEFIAPPEGSRWEAEYMQELYCETGKVSLRMKSWECRRNGDYQTSGRYELVGFTEYRDINGKTRLGAVIAKGAGKKMSSVEEVREIYTLNRDSGILPFVAVLEEIDPVKSVSQYKSYSQMVSEADESLDKLEMEKEWWRDHKETVDEIVDRVTSDVSIDEVCNEGVDYVADGDTSLNEEIRRSRIETRLERAWEDEAGYETWVEMTPVEEIHRQMKESDKLVKLYGEDGYYEIFGVDVETTETFGKEAWAGDRSNEVFRKEELEAWLIPAGEDPEWDVGVGEEPEFKTVSLREIFFPNSVVEKVLESEDRVWRGFSE